MAQNIGFLNFGIGDDDKELNKLLDKNLEKGVKLQDILADMKIGTKGKSIVDDITKATIQSDRLAMSASKVAKAEEDLANSKRRGLTLAQDLINKQQQGLTLEEKLIIMKKQGGVIDARSALEISKRASVEQDIANKRARAQQQELLNEAKLEGIKKRNAQIGVKGIRDVNAELSKQNEIISSLTRNAAAYFSAYKVAQFAKEIVNVRGEFQGLELAFETMLGSAEKSRKMMAEVTHLALETPYTVSDVASNVKQLIAMGIEADKAMATMKALGDVSAGLSVPMWRIAINYGQVSALGRLQAREIRDFAMAGVPIVEELAKQLGKTTGEITDMVSAGKIGFPEVEKAFQSMAGEGGKFNNMMEKQNSTMKGQMNRLEDQVQLMMNSIGKSNEGIIYGAIGAASDLVENYEKVGKTIFGLVAIYRTYKGILMGISAIENVRAAMLITQIASTTTLTTTQTALAVSTNVLSFAVGKLNGLLAVSPYILAATAIVGLGYGIYEVATAASEAELLLDAFNKSIKEQDEYIDSLKGSTSNLLTVINSSTETYEKQALSFSKLKEQYPDALKNIDLFRLKTMSATEQQKLFNQALYEQGEAYKKGNIERLEAILARINNRDTSTKDWSAAINEAREVLGKDGFFDYFSTLQADIPQLLSKHINDMRSDMDKSSETIKKSADEFVTYDRQIENTKKQISTLSAELKSLQKGIAPATLKVGEQFDFAKGIENKAKELKDAEEKLNLLQNGEKKTKQTRDTKDPELTKLEKRIDLLKTARSEYEKLSKVMDKDAAFADISKNPAFKDISQSDLSSDGFIKAIDAYIAEVSKMKVSDQRDKLLANLFTLKGDTTAKIIKEASDEIEKELQKYKGKYDLYQQLLGITNNEEQSKQLVFGDANAMIASYRDKLIEAIDKTDNSELKKKLQDQLLSFDVSEQENFLKEMAKMLSSYQTTEDKITQIKADGVREREKIIKSTSDKYLQDKLVQVSYKKEKEQIDKLQSESLKLSPFYQKLFGDIGNYGNKMLGSIIQQTQDILDLAKSAPIESDGKRTIEVGGTKYALSDEDIARMTKQMARLRREMAKNNPFISLKNAYDEFVNAKTPKDKEDAISQLGEAVKKVGELVNSLSNDFANMFDALGNEDLADTISLVGDLTNSLANVASGIMTGNPVSVIQGIVGGITSIANFHDKRLNKAIKKSQLEVKNFQNAYTKLQRTIIRQLGAVSEKQASDLIKNQEKQISELEYQRAKELDKKKKDRSVVADLENQIAEAKDQLKYFYEDLAKEQWGVNLGDWAKQLSDSITDAFAKGEDAAKAFDDTVASIMKNVVQNMIATSVIEPAMNNLRNKLFGQGGLLANGTTDLSQSDAVAISDELMKLKSEIAKSKEIWDYINDATGGILDETAKNKDGLSKGIQGIKEDQVDLLASYVNAIRADGSVRREYLLTLVELSQYNTNTFGQMLASLHAIQRNTGRTADNTLLNSQTVGEIRDLLNQLTISGSGKRLNV